MIALPDGMIAAFGLVLARTSALVLSTPVLGFGTGFSGYKIALIFALTALFYSVSGVTVVPGLAPIALAALALREVLIGLYLGFFLHLATLVARVAGELVGHEMGFMIARQVDPVSGVQSSLITSLYENLLMLALLALNGHHWIIDALARSFQRAPVGELALGQGMAGVVQRMFGEMFGAGIVFAAPVLVFLMLTSILLGLLARVVPYMNVLEVGFGMRVSISLGAMFLFAPLLEPAMTNLHLALVTWLDRGVDALGGA
jgi:flagellar biosynthetic protein FliR